MLNLTKFRNNCYKSGFIKVDKMIKQLTAMNKFGNADAGHDRLALKSSIAFCVSMLSA